MTILRWILLLPAVVAVAVVIYGLGAFVMGYADGQCPQTQMAAGVCIAPWHITVFDSVIYAGTVLLPAAAVLTASAIAPRAKLVIGVITLLLLIVPLLWARMQMGQVPLPLGNLPDQVVSLTGVAALVGVLCLVWVRTWGRSAT